jgi:hypothetical protein
VHLPLLFQHAKLLLLVLVDNLDLGDGLVLAAAANAEVITAAAAAGGKYACPLLCRCPPSKLAGYSYKVPRLVSPIRESYLENFQALPEILDGCIIRAQETTQERFFFSVLMEAGMVLSGKEAKSYSGTHYRIQGKKERRTYSD